MLTIYHVFYKLSKRKLIKFTNAIVSILQGSNVTIKLHPNSFKALFKRFKGCLSAVFDGVGVSLVYGKMAKLALYKRL